MADICIATIADKLSEGGHVLSHIVLGACIIIGIALIVLAGVHYNTHRRNPKLVPLGKPILYVVLGLSLIAIPFLEQYVGETGRSAAKKIHEKSHASHCYDIDAPIE